MFSPRAFLFVLVLTTAFPHSVQAGPSGSSSDYGGSCDSGLVKTLSVTGQGSTAATPDLATFSAGVSVLAKTATEALDENSVVMNDILQVLRTDPYHIDAADISTSNFNMYPEYDYGGPLGNDQMLVGYRVNNNVRVTVRDLDALGDLLDAVVSAGANQIGSINFGFADTSTLLAEARAAAVDDAAAKAALYAESAKGVTLGPILTMTEPGATQVSYGGAGYAATSADFAAAPPIVSGDQDIVASIHVVYALVED